MRLFFILVTSLFIFAVFIKASRSNKVKSPEALQNELKAYKSKYATGCSPDLAAIDFSDIANSIPLLSGWGSYRMQVTSTNDSANIYFQQGINMYYGFHIIEALASFEKAIKFDENFAMGYWGKALAYGPNINDMGYTASPEALTAVKNAIALNTSCTPLEKALMDAMSIRYNADTTQTRAHLNQLYADKMETVMQSFPNSADAATLYADALMVKHPWDLYDSLYKPKPWTPKIVAVLEQVIKRFPNNPGAGHYYIHAVEGSAHPQKGLAIANKLGAMMPGLSHLVHMPSHIYIRSGHYNKGIQVNELAVTDYNNYLDKFQPVVNGSFLYLMHNQHMQIACAMMDGQYNNAIKCSEKLNTKIDSSMLDSGGYFGVFSQYVFMSPQFIQLRFGKWDDVLKMPEVSALRVYAGILSHFARGIAFAKTKQLGNAENELSQLQQALSNPQLKEAPPAFNPGIAGSFVAEKILQGVIAEEKNDLPTAIAFLKKAVKKEDGMLYGEPRDWLLPARHYLVAVLLKSQQYKEAEEVCKEDLFVNPNNAWSLMGLKIAQEKQGKKSDAAITMQGFKKSVARADVRVSNVVF